MKIYMNMDYNAIFDQDLSIFELNNSETVVHKSLSTLFCVCPPSHPFICPPMLKNLSKTIFDRFLQRVFYHLSPKIRSNVEGFWNQKSSCNWKRWLLHCGVKRFFFITGYVGKNKCQSFFSVTHTVSGVKIIFHWAYRWGSWHIPRPSTRFTILISGCFSAVLPLNTSYRTISYGTTSYRTIVPPGGHNFLFEFRQFMVWSDFSWLWFFFRRFQKSGHFWFF